VSLLSSFETPIKAVVIGASGGIGAAVTQLLAKEASVRQVYALSRTGVNATSDKIITGTIDIMNEVSIAQAATWIGAGTNLIFVATGMLHDAQTKPEKSWRALDADTMARAFAINSIGPALVIKHFLPLLPRDQRAIFAALSARVGSINDNQLGGWYSYRAAKAALNQIIRTASIELTQKYPLSVCVGLHPGTVDTPLSKPFQGNVPTGKLFTPGMSARSLLSVLNGLTPAESGSLFAWDGARIDF
jgi:NAD(P)-dependent dehydrogenase (short-subunit alcohol dehydrogenase family)